MQMEVDSSQDAPIHSCMQAPECQRETCRSSPPCHSLNAERSKEDTIDAILKFGLHACVVKWYVHVRYPANSGHLLIISNRLSRFVVVVQFRKGRRFDPYRKQMLF